MIRIRMNSVQSLAIGWAVVLPFHFIAEVGIEWKYIWLIIEQSVTPSSGAIHRCRYNRTYIIVKCLHSGVFALTSRSGIVNFIWFRVVSCGSFYIIYSRIKYTLQSNLKSRYTNIYDLYTYVANDPPLHYTFDNSHMVPKGL